jgi:hypothetical protein
VELLLDGGEEAVEVDVEEAEAVGLWLGRHGFLRLYSPFVSLLGVGVPLPADFAQSIHFRLVRFGLLLQDIVSKWFICKILKIKYLSVNRLCGFWGASSILSGSSGGFCHVGVSKIIGEVVWFVLVG